MQVRDHVRVRVPSEPHAVAEQPPNVPFVLSLQPPSTRVQQDPSQQDLPSGHSPSSWQSPVGWQKPPWACLPTSQTQAPAEQTLPSSQSLSVWQTSVEWQEPPWACSPLRQTHAPAEHTLPSRHEAPSQFRLPVPSSAPSQNLPPKAGGGLVQLRVQLPLSVPDEPHAVAEQTPLHTYDFSVQPPSTGVSHDPPQQTLTPAHESPAQFRLSVPLAWPEQSAPPNAGTGFAQLRDQLLSRVPEEPHAVAEQLPQSPCDFAVQPPSTGVSHAPPQQTLTPAQESPAQSRLSVPFASPVQSAPPCAGTGFVQVRVQLLDCLPDSPHAVAEQLPQSPFDFAVQPPSTRVPHDPFQQTSPSPQSPSPWQCPAAWQAWSSCSCSPVGQPQAVPRPFGTLPAGHRTHSRSPPPISSAPHAWSAWHEPGAESSSCLPTGHATHAVPEAFGTRPSPQPLHSRSPPPIWSGPHAWSAWHEPSCPWWPSVHAKHDASAPADCREQPAEDPSSVPAQDFVSPPPAHVQVQSPPLPPQFHVSVAVAPAHDHLCSAAVSVPSRQSPLAQLSADEPQAAAGGGACDSIRPAPQPCVPSAPHAPWAPDQDSSAYAPAPHASAGPVADALQAGRSPNDAPAVVADDSASAQEVPVADAHAPDHDSRP